MGNTTPRISDTLYGDFLTEMRYNKSLSIDLNVLKLFKEKVERNKNQLSKYQYNTILFFIKGLKICIDQTAITTNNRFSKILEDLKASNTMLKTKTPLISYLSEERKTSLNQISNNDSSFVQFNTYIKDSIENIVMNNTKDIDGIKSLIIYIAEFQYVIDNLYKDQNLINEYDDVTIDIDATIDNIESTYHDLLNCSYANTLDNLINYISKNEYVSVTYRHQKFIELLEK